MVCIVMKKPLKPFREDDAAKKRDGVIWAQINCMPNYIKPSLFMTQLELAYCLTVKRH